jgi:hypothetical protein
MKIRFSLSVVALMLCIPTFGQVEYLDRVELDYKNDFYVSQLYNFHENGILISAVEDVKRSQRDPKRIYVLYDTDLAQLESFEVDVTFRQKLTATHEGEKSLHTLYYDMRKGEYTIVSIDPMNSKRFTYEGDLPPRLDITSIRVIGKMAVINAFLRKKRVLYIIDLEVGSFVERFYEKQSRRNDIYLIDVVALPGEKEVCITAQEYARKVMVRTSLYLINLEGEISKPYTLDAGNRNIVDATPTRMSESEIIVAGTYSKLKSTGAEGMFICSFEGNNQKYFKSYDFLDFENFFSYMSERSQEKMEKKIDRKKQRGKEVSINVRMVLHEVLRSDGLNYLLGEVYYPTYRTETRTTYINGRPTTTTYQVFDGYQYTHAVLCSFDENGDKVEDDIFEMWLMYKPFYVKKFVELTIEENTIRMVYVDGNRLVTKVLEDGDLRNKESISLEGSKAHDEIRGSVGTIEQFYGNNFIAYGTQRIKNTKDDDVKRKRNVFYMQKIVIP